MVAAAFSVMGVLQLKPFTKNLIIAAAASAVTFGATTFIYAVSGVNFNMGIGEKVSGGFDGKNSLNAKLGAINTYLKNEYLYDDCDFEKMNEAALEAYVEAIGEPYTHYYSTERFESYVGGVEDSYVGIGIVISVDEEADKIIIVAPTKDSPAYSAGILPGDYLISVNGTEYNSEQMDECVKEIKSGTAGTTVAIKVERNGEIFDYKIKRDNISANSVESEMLEDGVGYVRISSFNTSEPGADENTFTEFKTELEKLKKNGMKKLVIDLRDNPGGVLEVVCNIADYLLPEGTITYTEDKFGKRVTYSSDSSALDIPMAVIINGNSASASEILTGALKDFGCAKVVGEQSFGKGIVQNVVPFSDGSGMSMTTAKYYTPSGVCIHGVGIEPDYKVEAPEKYKNGYASQIPHEEDTQLKKALEILK